jgi:hypothetical protein
MRLAATVLTLAPVFHAFVLPGEWGSVGRWAAEAVGGVEEVLGGDETQKTIWQQIKDDDKYTKLVKILEVGGILSWGCAVSDPSSRARSRRSSTTRTAGTTLRSLR